MRLMIAFGLAIGLSLVAEYSTSAQSFNQPAPSRFDSALTTLNWPTVHPAARSRRTQEPAVASPVQEDNAASPADIVGPAPVPADHATTHNPDCKANFTPGSYFNTNNSAACGSSCCKANWTVGIYGLAFWRDYEDDVGLSAVPGNLSQYLNSTSAETGTMGGIEAVISRRDCNGCGFEIGYWGLYPATVDARLDGSPYTNVTGLSQVEFGGFPVSRIYNGSTYHRIYRDNTINNLELNLLRCIGSTDCCTRHWEWLAGFRYFSFDENFRYATFSANPNYPPALYYDLDTQNDLYGFQFGAQSERCLNCRWGYQFGATVGIYNNHIQASQSIHDAGQAYAEILSGPYAGDDHNFDSSKDDVAVSGELDLGLTYQFSCTWRAVGGFRVLGISGVALAPDQIPINFTDSRDINRIKSDGSLILYGTYFGVEHSF